MSEEVGGNKPVVLTGFSGSGKTSVGRRLAEVSELEWVDLDSLIEEKSKKKITEIIREEGEKAFRALETTALREVLDRKVGVISLGGGALLKEENKALIKDKALLVNLFASPDVIADRVLADENTAGGAVLRPLLDGDSKSHSDYVLRIKKLMKERAGIYDSADYKVWTDWTSSEKVASLVLENLQNLESGLALMPAVAKSEDLLSSLGEICITKDFTRALKRAVFNKFPLAKKLAVVTDEQVWSHHESRFDSVFANSDLELKVIVLPAGEKTKSLSFVEQTLEDLVESGFTRTDVVLALGGGVIGDLGGLIASVFMRGVGFIQIPTTIVAQVDSAIGGKTGVNLESGKNLVGTFYPATVVISDQSFLSTLPEREFNAGLAEVVKYGFIYSSEFFDWLEENTSQIKARDQDVLREIVEFSSKVKLNFVCSDLKDLSGRRAILNFGHTLGHAIEKLAGYGEFLHGEAVSIGMVFALRLAELKGEAKPGISKRAEKILSQFSLPTELPANLMQGSADYLDELGLNKEEDVFLSKLSSKEGFGSRWEKALRADKKRLSNTINFIFVTEIGKSKVQEIELSYLVNALAWLVR